MIVILAVVPPAGISTLTGNEAAGSELVKNTVIVPGAAGASKVTVPAEVAPPSRVLGFRVKFSRPISVS